MYVTDDSKMATLAGSCTPTTYAMGKETSGLTHPHVVTVPGYSQSEGNFPSSGEATEERPGERRFYEQGSAIPHLWGLPENSLEQQPPTPHHPYLYMPSITPFIPPTCPPSGGNGSPAMEEVMDTTVPRTGRPTVEKGI